MSARILEEGIFTKGLLNYGLFGGLMKDAEEHSYLGVDTNDPVTAGALAINVEQLYPREKPDEFVKKLSNVLGVDEEQIQKKSYSSEIRCFLACSKSYENHSGLTMGLTTTFRSFMGMKPIPKDTLELIDPSNYLRTEVAEKAAHLLGRLYGEKEHERDAVYNLLKHKDYISHDEITYKGKMLLEDAIRAAELPLQRAEIPTFVEITSGSFNLQHLLKDRGIDWKLLRGFERLGLVDISTKNDEFSLPGEWLELSEKTYKKWKNGIKRIKESLF